MIDTTTATRAQVEPATPSPLPLQLKNRDAARLKDYRLNLDFYNGKQWPNVRDNSTLRRIVANYIQATVDKTASYVLTGFQVSIRPDNPAGDAAARAAEAALAEISEANALPRLDVATEIDTAVLGDGCFKLAWDPDEKRVTIVAPDVAGIFAWPHPTDPNRFRRIAHRYQLTKADAIAYFAYNPPGSIATIIEDWTDDLLTIWAENLATPLMSNPNPYGFMPFVLYPNLPQPKTTWGRSDVAVMMPFAEELNAEYSRLSNIMELSGNPIAVLTGVDRADGVETFPGATWTLPPGADAKVFDLLLHGVADQHLRYITELKEVLHDVSETPKTAFGGNEKELSGIALEVDLQPLLQKVGRKRVIRSEAYAARAMMALQILDKFAGTDHATAGAPVVSWQAPTPRDRQRDVTIETLAVTGELSSRHSAIERLGDADPDEELAAIEAERGRGFGQQQVDNGGSPA